MTYSKDGVAGEGDRLGDGARRVGGVNFPISQDNIGLALAGMSGVKPGARS